MRGAEVIVSSEQRGVFKEGVISGALLPGTMVEIDPTASTFPSSGGEFQWRAYQPGTNGNRKMVAILLPDRLQGKLITDAYTTLTRCFIYVPVAGEQLNILCAGDSASHAVGDIFIGQTSTGILVVTSGSPQSQPFQLMEAFTSAQTTANFLAWMIFTGY